MKVKTTKVVLARKEDVDAAGGEGVALRRFNELISECGCSNGPVQHVLSVDLADPEWNLKALKQVKCIAKRTCRKVEVISALYSARDEAKLGPWQTVEPIDKIWVTSFLPKAQLSAKMQKLPLSSTQLNTLDYLDGQAITPVSIGVDKLAPADVSGVAATLSRNSQQTILSQSHNDTVTFAKYGAQDVYNVNDRFVFTALGPLDGATVLDLETAEVLTKEGKTVFVELGNGTVNFSDIIAQGGAIVEDNIIRMDRLAATAKRACFVCG